MLRADDHLFVAFHGICRGAQVARLLPQFDESGEGSALRDVIVLTVKKNLHGGIVENSGQKGPETHTMVDQLLICGEACHSGASFTYWMLSFVQNESGLRHPLDGLGED